MDRKALRLFPFLLVGMVLVLPAHITRAQDFVLSSGAPEGYYHSVASRVVMLLREADLQAAHLTSSGSLDNLALLADPASSVNVALVQADALRFYLDEHPGFAKGVVVLDDLGRECAALITRTDGGIENAGDLKKGGVGTLVLPGPGSGATVTLEYMRRMEPAYRETPVSHRDPMEAMLQMRMPGGDQIAAVMLVKRPRVLTPEFEIVLENPDQFRVAPIRQTDVKNGRLPDGSPVYSFERVTTGAGIDYQVSFDTICTRALMVTSSSKLSKRRRRDLARVLLKWGKLIAPGR